jgi:hypothetical protein
MKAQFTQKIIGTGERKTLLIPIAEKAEQSVQYAGAPSFAYTAAGWSVNRDSVVSSPEFEIDSELERHASLPELLRDAGATSEGQLTVTIIPDNVDEEKAAIMRALLQSKESLIRKALGTDQPLEVAVAGSGYTFAFYTATLDHADIMAAIQFAHCIYEQSFQQKRVTSSDKPVDNEKYAFRCFLLRIGMIGKEYGTARKVLGKNLSGNSSFKSGERKKPDKAADQPIQGAPIISEETFHAAQAAMQGRAAGPDDLAEALADAELVHGVNVLMEGTDE